MRYDYRFMKYLILFLLHGWLLACQAGSIGSDIHSVNQDRSKGATSVSKSPALYNHGNEENSLSRIKQESKHVTKWLFVGDSLTAGYGLEPEAAYVALIQKKIHQEAWLDAESKQVPILINAGISGDTSAGALRRIDWLLAEQPSRVFLCIGANDGLRGQAVSALEMNLTKLIEKIKKKGIQVTLMGMQVPSNYGPEYSAQFKQSYQTVAESQKIALYPFLLKGVGGVAELNQSDGIHPNHEGQQKIATQLFEYILQQAYLSKADK